MEKFVSGRCKCVNRNYIIVMEPQLDRSVELPSPRVKFSH